MTFNNKNKKEINLKEDDIQGLETPKIPTEAEAFGRCSKLSRSPVKTTNVVFGLPNNSESAGPDMFAIFDASHNYDTTTETHSNHSNGDAAHSPPKNLTGIERYFHVIKRRRSPRAANLTNDAKKVKINEFAVPTGNRFTVLVDQPTGSTDKVINHKAEKPPPIYLREETSSELIHEIKKITKDDFVVSCIKRGRVNETRIQAQSIESFRAIRDLFEKQQQSFYTYQLKSAKGISVVIKGIEAKVPPEEVAAALTEKGFCVKNCVNILNRKKEKQPMFRVELEGGASIAKSKDIYNLRGLMYRRIVVEEPHKRTDLVQCHKCQEFGHTKTYCRLTAVCVICSGAHNVKECQTNRNDVAVKKCGNCTENHTANYRGCPVYVELKNQLRLKQRREHRPVNQQYNFSKSPDPTPVLTSNAPSYASILKTTKQPIADDNLNRLISMMENFMKSMENSMNILMQSFATITQLLAKHTP